MLWLLKANYNEEKKAPNADTAISLFKLTHRELAWVSPLNTVTHCFDTVLVLDS